VCSCKVELKELLPNLQPCKHLCETSAFKNVKNIPSCRSQNTRYQHQKPRKKSSKKSSPEPILLSTQKLGKMVEKQLIFSLTPSEAPPTGSGRFPIASRGDVGFESSLPPGSLTAKAPENKPGPKKESRNFPVPSIFQELCLC